MVSILAWTYVQQRSLCAHALLQANGVKTEAARLIGLTRRHFIHKLHEYRWMRADARTLVIAARQALHPVHDADLINAIYAARNTTELEKSRERIRRRILRDEE